MVLSNTPQPIAALHERDLGSLPPFRSALTNVGIFAVGSAPIVAGTGWLMNRLVLGCLVSVLLVVSGLFALVIGRRTNVRQSIVDNAIENIGGSLKPKKLSRGLIVASHWTSEASTSLWKLLWRSRTKLLGREEAGYPQKVVIRYSRTINGRDEEWVSDIVGAVGSNFESNYAVTSHNHLRKRLVLDYEPLPEIVVPEVIELSEGATQVHTVVKELLGETAAVTVEEDQEGNITGVIVQHQHGNAMAIAGKRIRVEKIISARMPHGRWVADWDVVNATVTFARKQELEFPIFAKFEPVEAENRRQLYEELAIPLGMGEGGKTMLWRPFKDAHLLVSGGTGSGKTNLEGGVVQFIAFMLFRVWIIDGKRVEFIDYRDYPNVEIIAAKVEHCVRLILAAHELMEERYSLVEEGRAKLNSFEPLFVVVDEFATLVTRIGRWWRTIKPKGSPAVCPVIELVEDIARLGRTAGIHLCIGLQRPDVKFVGGEMRDNFGSRVSVGRMSPQGANMMWDSYAIGVAVAPIKGRGVAVDAGGRPVEFQAYWNPKPDGQDDNPEVLAVLKQGRPVENRFPRKVVETIDEVIIDDNGEERAAEYWDYATASIIDAPDYIIGELVEEAPEELTAKSKPRTKQADSATEADTDANAQEIAEAAFNDYEPEESRETSELATGYLILLEPDIDQWVIITQIDSEGYDDGDESVLLEVVDFETGEEDSISVSISDVFDSRRPRNYDNN